VSKVGYDAVKIKEPVPMTNSPCPNKSDEINKIIKELEKKEKLENEKKRKG